MTFCILSGLAIVMVVAGHLGYNLMTMGNLFPYYSFHVPLFMFISGYFYKDTEEEHPLSYAKKKCVWLLVPYLVWNLFFLLAWRWYISQSADMYGAITKRREESFSSIPAFRWDNFTEKIWKSTIRLAIFLILQF